MTNEYIGFGSLMRILRNKRGISARALSLESGLSASYVNKIETGATLPTISCFAAIIKNLDASKEEVMYLLFSLLPEGAHVDDIADTTEV